MLHSHHNPLPIDPELEALYDELEHTPEDTVDDMMDQVVYQVGRRMNELGWTQKRLAEEADMAPATLSRLLKADNTSLKTVARVAHALGLVFAALKLVPADKADEQVDEVAAFVRTEAKGGPWWPATRRRDIDRWLRHETAEPEASGAPQLQPSYYPEAEGAAHGAFLLLGKRVEEPSGPTSVRWSSKAALASENEQVWYDADDATNYLSQLELN